MKLLPLADGPPPERADAARNREALLVAASDLVAEQGVEAVTMEHVAQRAGVGKGTVFRRFESRSGLMAALLDHAEAAWQQDVISGPPPLGPGAPGVDRLLAFGRSRTEVSLQHATLLEAASRTGSRSLPAYSFVATHVRHLLGEIGLHGDLDYLTTALLAPLEPVVLIQKTRDEGLSLERLQHGWADLVRRVVTPPRAGAGRR